MTKMQALKTFYDAILVNGQQVKRTVKKGLEFEARNDAHADALERKGIAARAGGTTDGQMAATRGGRTVTPATADRGASRVAPDTGPLPTAGGQTGGTRAAPLSSQAVRVPAKPTSSKPVKKASKRSR